MKKTLSLVLLSSIFSIAHAHNTGHNHNHAKPVLKNPFDAQGRPAKFYVGANVGNSKHADNCSESFVNNPSCVDDGLAWKLYGGVKLNPMFGLEGGYRKLNDSSISGTDGSGNPLALEKEISAFDLAAVGYFPVSNEVELFGKAGLAHWKQDVKKTQNVGSNESTESGNSLMVGAGASYNMNQNVSIRGEWERIMDAGTTSSLETDIDMLSAGVTFSAF